MKKFIFGLLVGLLIAIPVGSHAAEVENLIGRLVEGVFPVKVDGTQIEKQAIVIDGTSYLPVRAIGDALNLDVSFNADLGIELKRKDVGGGDVTAPEVNATEGTYDGIKSITVGNEQYFYLIGFLKKYYDQTVYTGRRPTIFAWDDTNRTITVKNLNGVDNILSADNQEQVQAYNDETYINIKYYPDVNNGLVKPVSWYREQLESSTGEEKEKLQQEFNRFYPDR